MKRLTVIRQVTSCCDERPSILSYKCCRAIYLYTSLSQFRVPLHVHRKLSGTQLSCTTIGDLVYP